MAVVLFVAYLVGAATGTLALVVCATAVLLFCTTGGYILHQLSDAALAGVRRIERRKYELAQAGKRAPELPPYRSDNNKEVH